MEIPKRVLFVGDDPMLTKLQTRLTAADFELVHCPDSETTVQYVTANGLPHIMLVKLNLPDMSGLELCRKMLRLNDLPIIVLADPTDDKPGMAAQVLLFADDYVRAPIDLDELVMRIRRVLSRIENFSYAAASRIQICDNLAVDYTHRLAIVDGQERQLTPTESALLDVLVKHQGHVVDTDTLIERVWHSGTVIRDRNALRVHVHRLRDKIEPDPDNPVVVLTERGVGYQFAVC
jgi:DNA-binding response OmpR family regulator